MITIGIKALNEEQHIAASLASACAAVEPFGGCVILADSGSIDRTVEIAKDFPVRILQLADPAQRSCGTGAQLAFQEAAGEFFYLLDGDMVLNPDFIAKGIGFLRDNPDYAAVGGSVREAQTSSIEFQLRARSANTGEPATTRQVDRLDCGGLYRIGAIRSAGHFADRNLHAFEEFELGARLRAQGWKLARIAVPAVDHYGHTVGGYRLMWRRLRSGYAGGPGEVVRAALGKPHIGQVVRQLFAAAQRAGGHGVVDRACRMSGWRGLDGAGRDRFAAVRVSNLSARPGCGWVCIRWRHGTSLRSALFRACCDRAVRRLIRSPRATCLRATVPARGDSALAVSGMFSKFMWTVGTIGASSVLKFGQNVTLSRLLVPEILGIMVVVNSVRMGVELLTDVGIEQNIIHHDDGLERRFRDTAWSLQVLRGLMVSAIFVAASPVLSATYGIDVRIFLLAACAPMLSALHSTAIFVLVKQLEVRRRSLFELFVEVLGAIVTISLAVVLRSVWAPVIGLVATAAMRAILSFTLPDPAQRLAFDRAVVMRILHFGKWIALSSLVMYAATNIDRLYLGGVIPLASLGIYGIARAIAELPTTLARRISYQVIFPSLAGTRGRMDSDIYREVARTRLMFALAACGGIAFTAAMADQLIAVVYDPRYHAAGWMLAVLLLGGIFAILSNLNEALLLAAGKPAFASLANMMRLGTLAIGLIGGFALYGLPGAVIAVATVEACHYGYIAIGQLRIGRGFWKSDMVAIGFSFGVFVAMLAARQALGWGSPFAGISEVLG